MDGEPIRKNQACALVDANAVNNKATCMISLSVFFFCIVIGLRHASPTRMKGCPRILWTARRPRERWLLKKVRQQTQGDGGFVLTVANDLKPVGGVSTFSQRQTSLHGRPLPASDKLYPTLRGRRVQALSLDLALSAAIFICPTKK
jgi:hypothetical protein